MGSVTKLSTGVFELGVFAAYLNGHGGGLAVAIAPEPAMFAIEGGNDLAFFSRRTAAPFIGHRLTAAMAVQVKVDAPALDQHPVFCGLALGHNELPLGGVSGCQGEGGLIAPDLRFLSVGRPDEQAEDAV